MLPPPDVIRDYFDQMYQQAAAASAKDEERRRLRNEIETKKLQLELANMNSPAPQARRSIDTYEQQITAWFNRLPPDARKAPRSMEELINLLIGRTPGFRAHAPDVSRALQRMGWLRHRIWQSDGEGRRIWLPPFTAG